MTAPGRITVLVADDHAIFRQGVARLIERVADIEIVGEASTGSDAVERAGSVVPDVVLMDLQMPDLDGIEATRVIVRDSPHIGVIVLTMRDDDDAVLASIAAGARGYVLKDADPEALLRAIRSVAGGEALLGAGVAHRVLARFSAEARTSDVAARPLLAQLTAREREILTLIARGMRNREIAEALVLSEKTVGNHISNIFSKLQVNDRSQAILRALRAGLVRLEE